MKYSRKARYLNSDLTVLIHQDPCPYEVCDLFPCLIWQTDRREVAACEVN